MRVRIDSARGDPDRLLRLREIENGVFSHPLHTSEPRSTVALHAAEERHAEIRVSAYRRSSVRLNGCRLSDSPDFQKFVSRARFTPSRRCAYGRIC